MKTEAKDETRSFTSGWCESGNHSHCKQVYTSQKFGGGTVSYLCPCECHIVVRRVRKPATRRKARRPVFEGRRRARRPDED